MLALLIFATAVTSIAAQNGTQVCDCALFASEDKPGNRNSVLIGYLGTPQAPASDCEADSIFDTACYNACEEIGTVFKLGSGHCESHIYENRETCFGDVWCERIGVESPGFTSNGTWVVKAFAALRQCPGQEDIEFTEVVQPEGEQRICCENEMLTPCDDEDCECDEATFNDCECGIFVPQMFGAWRPNPNVDPLPLSWVGTQFNTSDWQETCGLFPSATDDEICSAYCRSQEENLVGYKLTDPFPNNPLYTFGQTMCAGLFAKVNKYEAFENEPLQVHGRVGNCDSNDNTWAADVVFGQNDELLCCDANGGWYECPARLEL